MRSLLSSLQECHTKGNTLLAISLALWRGPAHLLIPFNTSFGLFKPLFCVRVAPLQIKVKANEHHDRNGSH